MESDVNPIVTSVEEIHFPPYRKGLWLDREAIRTLMPVGNYIAMIDGRFLYGEMGRDHNMRGKPGNCLYSHLLFQVDLPGHNGCHTQKIWRVHSDGGLTSAEAILICAGVNPVELSRSLEQTYAVTRRMYCIDHRMTSNGRTITEEAPIEAFLYKPLVAAMPVLGNREDFEDDL